MGNEKTISVNGDNIAVEKVKVIFSSMLKEHERNILELISANHKIMNDRMDKMEKRFDSAISCIKALEDD